MNDYSILKNHQTKQADYIRDAQAVRAARLIQKPGRKAHFMLRLLMIAL